MKPEVVGLLEKLHSPKSRKAKTAAIENLKSQSQDHIADLIDALSMPEYEQNLADVKGFFTTKSHILRILFERPTKQLIKDTVHLLDCPYEKVWREYACCVSGVGEVYSLDVVEQCITHFDKQVRAYTTYGLRNVARLGGFTKGYARRAGELLHRFSIDYPEEPTIAWHAAFEVFNPKAHAKIMAAKESKDPIDRLSNNVFAVADNFTSARDALTGFDGFPEGYLYFYAAHSVDAEIRNGGVSQLYANTTWCLILDAIQGWKRFGFAPLADVLKGVVYYYYTTGRSKLKRRITKGFFENYKPSATTLDELEDEYYSTFEGFEGDPFRSAIENHSDAFA